MGVCACIGTEPGLVSAINETRMPAVHARTEGGHLR